MAASTPVDSVLRQLEELFRNIRRPGSFHVYELKLNLLFLKTFFLCARKWSNNNNDVYIKFIVDNLAYMQKTEEKVPLRSFLFTMEDTLNKYGRDIQSLCSRSGSTVINFEYMISAVEPVLSSFRESLKSFKQKIISAYTSLSDYNSSLQSSFCAADDKLVDFIDSILHNLVHLLKLCFIHRERVHSDLVPAQIEALEDKLKFLKSLICFANLFCLDHHQANNLDHLLRTHIQSVALSAARLSYMCWCFFYKQLDEKEVRDMCTMMSELLDKRVDLQVYETCIKVLIKGVSKSSASSLQTTKMDKNIVVVREFNDSLISCLWELLLCNTTSSSFMVSVKGQMQILYEGLRFLRSILLRELQEEHMDELDGKVITVLIEAGVVICSLCVNSLDCCAMLVDINSHINLIKAQITGSGMIESLPSYQIFKGQEVGRTPGLLPSIGKIPKTHEVVVELMDEAEKVIDRLVRGSENLEIIPIVGMPGLGKTTLARRVHNHPSSLHHFHIRLWCSVSQLYNQKDLLLQMLLDDGKYSKMNEEVKIYNEDDLLQQLYQKLKGNRYLVVFDDVWDIGVWNDLRCSFPHDKKGSRILLTSRFSNVASKVGIGREPHDLRSLTDSESWELLQKKVFGKEDCPQALHGLGMEIAKNCKGLPLTVVIVAGILATIEHDGWEEVAKSLTSTIVYETDQCKNTLELSYTYLPHYLKPCLLYFGAFPEDQEIHTKKLISLWIAEEFVQNSELRILEDLAEEYLMDLIGRNLVMVSKQRSIGGVKACRVHDLLHEFCKAKSKEENFLQVLHGYDELSTFNVLPNLERLSIWSKVEHFKKSKLFCPRICSLLLFNKIEESDSLMADISFVFCIYKNLRVLDLEQIVLRHEVFPGEVESLVELRNLGVQGSMRFIPPSIANLSNLETFLVKSEFGTVSLPDTIWNMTNLRHLNIWGWNGSCYLPSENLENTSACLQNLDTFSTPEVSLDQVEIIMSKIPNVRELKIQLSEAKNQTGYCKCNTRSPLRSLESLKVLGKDLLLIHIEFSFPMTLKELVLKELCLAWSTIQLIGKLPNVEVLKFLNDSFEGDRWDLTDGGFIKLRVLKLEYLDVVEWTDTDCGDPFPCLQKLMLKGVWNLEKIPSCFESISSLEVIMVQFCNDSVKNSVLIIEEEQKSKGNEDLKIFFC
ncbi:hypothetical protein ACH5RR_028357 [Cinchona calisaya]|uniref:Uncharacterized protein n=1 Tax=Cinchona calisaya TaxID=153742 RepID=A0ABD2YNI1_9GENT